MNGKNALLAIDLAISLATRLLAVTNAIAAAGAAGRDDLSAAELDEFRDADDNARDRLQAKIDRARAGG